jgi:hypothetical protein
LIYLSFSLSSFCFAFQTSNSSGKKNHAKSQGKMKKKTFQRQVEKPNKVPLTARSLFPSLSSMLDVGEERRDRLQSNLQQKQDDIRQFNDSNTARSVNDENRVNYGVPKNSRSAKTAAISSASNSASSTILRSSFEQYEDRINSIRNSFDSENIDPFLSATSSNRRRSSGDGSHRRQSLSVSEKTDPVVGGGNHGQVVAVSDHQDHLQESPDGIQPNGNDSSIPELNERIHALTSYLENVRYNFFLCSVFSFSLPFLLFLRSSISNTKASLAV